MKKLSNLKAELNPEFWILALGRKCIVFVSIATSFVDGFL